MRLPIIAATLLAFASPALAQHAGGHGPAMGASPYAGFASREIKAVGP